MFHNEDEDTNIHREDPYFWSDLMIIFMAALGIGYGMGYLMHPYYSSWKRSHNK